MTRSAIWAVALVAGAAIALTVALVASPLRATTVSSEVRGRTLDAQHVKATISVWCGSKIDAKDLIPILQEVYAAGLARYGTYDLVMRGNEVQADLRRAVRDALGDLDTVVIDVDLGAFSMFDGPKIPRGVIIASGGQR